MTLHAVVRENARSEPNAIALIDGDATLTYHDLDDRTERLASSLAELGIRRGDRIAWIGQNSNRWLEALVAAGRLGAMFCSLNWRSSRQELSDLLDYFAPALVFWQEKDLGPLELQPGEKPFVHRWIAHDDPTDAGYEALLRRPAAPFEQHDDTDLPVLLLPVASPDGAPTAAMLSHGNVLVPGLLMAHLQQIDRTTVNLASAPLFHIASLFSIVPTLLMRGTNVMVPRPDAQLLCQAIDAHRCTHGFLLAPTAEAILALDDVSSYDLRSFRSSLTLPAWREIVSDDPSPWGRRPGGYGQTETHMAVVASLGDGNSMTSGRAAPYAEIRLVDAEDREVPTGELGEITVRGPSVHQGYWQRDEVSARRFRNGWWHTGDLGRRDEDGTLTFVGPAGRMIKSGAENIFAAEVERCLISHPGIQEAGVIGVPDATWVQSVRAIIVPKQDAALTEADIQEFCRENLASYKKPRSVVFRDTPLPRLGPVIDHAALDEAYGGGGYPGEGTRSA